VKHILEGGGLYDVIFGSKWKVGPWSFSNWVENIPDTIFEDSFWNSKVSA